ncbi:MAG TPA: 2-amino-4-hydroxy-6-hydroxymethyldihydropteridine diphosphokinase [Blastocatellia bacterium]|nr:2-amino-4-hydroxy-6-hydroxymethyldihydropteridine diphosphokinase [Blastocatellia bacterium]
MPQTAYLGLGSNLGDRAANLLRALSALIVGDLRLVSASSIYETEPVDVVDQPLFLNMVVALTAPRLEPFSLLNFCLATETRLGRKRMIERGARTVDIDLLLLDDYVIEETRGGVELTLPHPRMHLRRFVLTPLVEIAPHLKHPMLGETMSHLLGALEDPAGVRVYRE